MSRTPARVALAAGVLVLAAGLVGCQSSVGDYVTDGKLTIATGEPAFYPWVLDDDPESGEGFEAAVAYAVAAQLGFAADDVVWVRTTFEEAIQPGPKTFDFNIQQFAITDDRREAVDFSSPYYETTQAVITTADSPAADATSLEDLRELSLGASVGTTSYDAIEEIIKPTQDPQAFNSNNDAKLALENDTVDAIVVDLPTAFYITGVELTNGLIVGQLPAGDGKTGEDFGLLLEKDSPLTDEVTAAVDALREDGTLEALAAEWLADSVDAPVLE
jgi:polar amino acid transport system substrate-binding protein